MKIARLTDAHIHPRYYELMHVALAADVSLSAVFYIFPSFYHGYSLILFQMFKPNVAAAMEIYRKTLTDLHDCDPTMTFINRINGVITAMSSRSVKNSLSINCESYKVIIYKVFNLK